MMSGQPPQDTPQNPVHEQLQRVASSLKEKPESYNYYDDILNSSAYGRCLLQLLEAFSWPIDYRYLARALPHLEPLKTLDDIRIVLGHLGFETVRHEKNLTFLREQHFPALVMDGDEPRVLLSREGAKGFGPANEDKEPVALVSHIEGWISVGKKIADSTVSPQPTRGWTFDLFMRLKSSIMHAALLTFIVNLIALMLPFYTSVVYDRVIGTKSLDTLLALASIVILAVFIEAKLRNHRSQILAYIGARLENTISVSTFAQVLHLPLMQTENAPLSNQIARFRQFKGLRDLFSGQTASTLLDLPFAIVFCFAISFLDPILVLIPLGFGVVFLLLGMATAPFAKRLTRKAGEARSRASALQMEMIHKAQLIQDLSAEKIFQLRAAEALEHAAEAKMSSMTFTANMGAIAQFLVALAGACTLGLGAYRVMTGDMSLGNLIAVMMLVWRVLSPMQAAFLHASKITQYRDAMMQIDGLMRLKTERGISLTPVIHKKPKGHLIFRGLSFRYAGSADATIRGVNLEIKPGEIVAITGSTGAGKSTLLKLLLGLYQSGSGSIWIDGLDIRQFNPIELRNTVGFSPQKPTFFHGTLAQNMRLVAPEMTDAQIKRLFKELGLNLDEHPSFPEGLETRLAAGRRSSLPDGVKAQINLARALAGEKPILAFDEPGAYVDFATDQLFIKKLLALRGRATTLVVTNRPSHMRVCDRVIFLKEGTIAADGTPDEIVPALMGQASATPA